MSAVRPGVLASLPCTDPTDRIIVALDGMAPDQALHLAASVPELRWVKVGLELFVAAGPAVVQQLRDQGKRVFLDLKFHDIPATMAGACRSAARCGAELITVHASAGAEALCSSNRGCHHPTRRRKVFLPSCSIRPSSSAAEEN